MSFSHYILNASTEIDNIIIPQGMLLSDLNHGLSVLAFYALAAKDGNKFDVKALMPLIEVADRKLKAGGKEGFNKQQFVDELRKIFSLVKASDDEIVHAWNQMLGNLSKFASAIDELRKRHPNKNIILMSGTSPIHIEAINAAIPKVQQEQKDDVETQKNPLQQCGLPLYVSFLQEAEDMKLRTNNTNLIEELMTKEKLDPKKTLLLLSLTSTSPIPYQKQAEEAAALVRKKWAEDQAFIVADFRKGKESVSDAIDNRLGPQVQQQSVSPKSNFAYATIFSTTSTTSIPAPQTTDTLNAATPNTGASSLRYGSSEHGN
jgi:hypothetical protein